MHDNPRSFRSLAPTAHAIGRDPSLQGHGTSRLHAAQGPGHPSAPDQHRTTKLIAGWPEAVRRLALQQKTVYEYIS
jgi:hypothetical protein